VRQLVVFQSRPVSRLRYTQLGVWVRPLTRTSPRGGGISQVWSARTDSTEKTYRCANAPPAMNRTALTEPFILHSHTPYVYTLPWTWSAETAVC
jgi:hypothetical protein